MKIHLRDRNIGLCTHWEQVFEDIDDVEISCGDIFAPGPHMSADALVSPANSFGFMDGGIDQVYTDYYGPQMQKDLQDKLKVLHDGELLVGQAIIIQLPPKLCSPKYLVCAPTMRVPCDVSMTVNAYLAFRATLRAVEDLNELFVNKPINSILCPGLGTAVGKMPYRKCARQMAQAYDEYDKDIFYSTLQTAHFANKALG